MCLAIPAEVVEISENASTGIVLLGGVRKSVSLALLDTVAVGDYVLLHVGFALSKISPEEAAKTLAIMEDAGMLEKGTSEAAEGGSQGGTDALS
ncbi:HypC/HybG/HupF family hydrogenase formation chaperone [Pseudovibrio sp. Tun.PSC04-5.I4]|uniref:HypC/HybG/HupF family hydrogenase formation chaperone n=1 Tax=Pseudovibrio sp. Tun.PSC04-5.I4 TaxID=1798213 RepID=UPI00088055C0|nr:HypC/HybG/HupF family hydrogenase formation chaperone [Pseudovibrio sp. Tun.PSC04-5.I4]SDQ12095.1 hydrogenase expression/formation protein HypC [Pseudovibrio sp. Tun.PSC04-5.I4]